MDSNRPVALRVGYASEVPLALRKAGEGAFSPGIVFRRPHVSR